MAGTYDTFFTSLTENCDSQAFPAVLCLQSSRASWTYWSGKQLNYYKQLNTGKGAEADAPSPL